MSIHVQSGQQAGTYSLATNLARSGAINLGVDGRKVASLGIGQTCAYNGKTYQLVASGGSLGLKLGVAAGNSLPTSSASHATVYGGTMGEFSRYAAAAAPAAARNTGGQSEAWKKSGMLA